MVVVFVFLFFCFFLCLVCGNGWEENFHSFSLFVSTLDNFFIEVRIGIKNNSTIN